MWVPFGISNEFIGSIFWLLINFEFNFSYKEMFGHIFIKRYVRCYYYRRHIENFSHFAKKKQN